MRTIFFGTPQFAADVLDYLLKAGVNIVAVVSKPDRPSGRFRKIVSTPVKQIAQAQASHVMVYQPEHVSNPEFTSILNQYDADLFVVVAYGEIIKMNLLNMPKLACINLHASLLPKYRGAAPIQRSIMQGETETGVSIMHMVAKMDAGDVIKEVVVPIACDATFGDIEQQLCAVGKKALLDVVQTFARGETLPRVSQVQTLVTMAPKIELEECEIHWEHSAEQIHNLVRGVNPHPGAWCYITIRNEKKRLKINRTRIIRCDTSATPGKILNIHEHKTNLLIATCNHTLELLEVQLEGRKATSSEEFTRGISRSNLSFI